MRHENTNNKGLQKSNVTTPNYYNQLDAIARFNALPENYKWAEVSNSYIFTHKKFDFIPAGQRPAWFVLPFVIVEKYLNFNGEVTLRPLKSFNQYLLRGNEINNARKVGEVNPHYRKEHFEYWN